VAAAPAAAKKFVPTRYDDPAPGACKVARSLPIPLGGNKEKGPPERAFLE